MGYLWANSLFSSRFLGSNHLAVILNQNGRAGQTEVHNRKTTTPELWAIYRLPGYIKKPMAGPVGNVELLGMK